MSLKLHTREQRKTRTVMDTLLVTPQLVKAWKIPPFQRPVKENNKVVTLAAALKSDSGVWPGIVTLGDVDGDIYIVDGQHRRAAFLLSGCSEGYCDVRMHYFDSIADAGEEFVTLNSALVKLNPDDILRGLEAALPELQFIRKNCPFVGYDMVRRKESSPIISMSVAIKAWRGAAREVPSNNSFDGGTTEVARRMSHDDAINLCNFLKLAEVGFGRDPQYYKLWGALNLTLSMWLYMRTVMTTDAKGHKRATRLSSEVFQKCLMSLSADPVYLSWLVGRSMRETDRSPAYGRIKDIFAKRAAMELGSKVFLPQPEWAA